MAGIISVASGVIKGFEGPACVLSGRDPGVKVCDSKSSGISGVDSAGWQAASNTIKSRYAAIIRKYLTESSSFKSLQPLDGYTMQNVPIEIDYETSLN
jgi:hypothetical protein